MKRYAPYEKRPILFTETFSDTCLDTGLDEIEQILLMEVEKRVYAADVAQLSRLHILREDYLAKLAKL